MKQISLLSMTVFSILLLSTTASLNAFAADSSDTVKPIITTRGDIYHVSTVPTPVLFSVSAHDAVDGEVKAYCDKSHKTVFKIGETTVRCMATDSAGNIARTSFVITVGDNFVLIPDWVKNLTQYWINGQITDKQYAASIKHLIELDVVHVPFNKDTTDPATTEIPVWIKTNSQKWVDGMISNDEFSIGIQWMLERGAIQF